MKKKFVLIFVVTLLALNSEAVFSQRKTTPRKASAGKSAVRAPGIKKSAPVDKDEVFQRKLQETLKTPQNWREYAFAEPGFKILFPRPPVLNQESIYDDFIGKSQVNSYFALSDDGVFAAAHLRLPYTIKDDAVLRNIYREISKGFFNGDEMNVTESKDVQYNGRPGLELSGTSRKNPSQKTVIRFFLVGKDVFFNLVMPYPSEDSLARQTAESQSKFEETTNDFFNSFVETASAAMPVIQPVSSLFKSTFVDDVFRSEYFNFTIKIPQGWHEIPQDDVSTMTESKKEIIKQNSKIDVSAVTNTRRNLFSYTAKPLGSEKNSMIVCNLLKKPFPEASVYEITKKIEETLAQIKFYTITKKTRKVNVGGTEFYSFEAKGAIADEEYFQSIYYCVKKDYAVGFVLTYYSEEEKNVLIDSLNSLKFIA